jgi:hypothetical protein
MNNSPEFTAIEIDAINKCVEYESYNSANRYELIIAKLHNLLVNNKIDYVTQRPPDILWEWNDNRTICFCYKNGGVIGGVYLDIKNGRWGYFTDNTSGFAVIITDAKSIVEMMGP